MAKKKPELNSFMKEIAENTRRILAEQEELKPSEIQLGHLMNGRYEEWNKTMEHFREEFPDKLLNVKFRDLRGKDLSHFDFRGVDLAGSKLEGAKLEMTLVNGNTNMAGVSIDKETFDKSCILIQKRWAEQNPNAKELMLKREEENFGFRAETLHRY